MVTTNQGLSERFHNLSSHVESWSRGSSPHAQGRNQLRLDCNGERLCRIVWLTLYGSLLFFVINPLTDIQYLFLDLLDKQIMFVSR